MEKFYIVSTGLLPEERLKRHLGNHKGFTSKTKDREIVNVESFDSISEARQREIQINPG